MKFEEHSDADITLIGSGVQILPDRWFFTEAFEWPSKKMLIDLINTHQKSGVILLSGDVHFAQFYHMNCQSLTGYNLTEMTTSGLTHHVNMFAKVADRVMDMVTPLFWNASELVMDFNFGLFRVKRVSNDIEVTLQVRDDRNNVRLARTLSLKKDMTYKKVITRYSKMCNAIHSQN